MTEDPIVAEVRNIREQQASRLNFDVRAIAQDVHERERRGGKNVVRLEKRKAPESMMVPSAKRT